MFLCFFSPWVSLFFFSPECRQKPSWFGKKRAQEAVSGNPFASLKAFELHFTLSFEPFGCGGDVLDRPCQLIGRNWCGTEFYLRWLLTMGTLIMKASSPFCFQ